MKSVTYNSSLNQKTGEFLSKKTKRSRVLRKTKLRKIQDSTQNSQSRLMPRRATSQLFRNFILASTLTTLIAQEISGDDIKNKIFNKEKSGDIFPPDQSKSNSTASPSFKPIFKENPKKIFKDSIHQLKDILLTDPSKALNLKSFSPEILLGFLNEKGFSNPDWTALTYLATFKDLQVNFLNILMHSSKNNEILKLITSQVDNKGNNILHISCQFENIDHLIAIFNNINSAYFDLNEKDVNEIKKEMIMKFNHEGYTPLMQAVKSDNSEIIKKILSQSKFFDKTDYSCDVLMQTNESGNSPLLIAITNKNYQLLESLLVNFDSYNSEQKKQIKQIFKNSNNQIFDDLHSYAVNNDSNKISQIIKTLKKINYTNEELKDLLTKQVSDEYGDTVFTALAYKGNIESISSILSAFDPSNEDDIKRLKEIFLAQNKQEFSAMHYLIDKNSDENIKKITEFLKKIGNENLKDLLTKQNLNSGGDNAFLFLAYKQRIESISSILSAFDPSNEDDAKRLKEIFLAQNKLGANALYFLVDRLDNISFFRCIEKIITKCSKEEIKEFFTQKVGDKQILPTFTSLLLAGNDKAIEEILKRDVKIEIDELPYSYFSGIPNLAIYYLEAFKKDANNQIKAIKYYNPTIEGEKIETKEVDFMDIKLNDDKDKQLIVEIIGNDNLSKKIIITDTNIKYSQDGIDGKNLNLQNTFKLAESNNLDQILIDLVIENYALLPSLSHAITIKLTRNNDGWDIVYHDSNSSAQYSNPRSEEFKETNEKAIKAICKQNGIRINSITEHDNIIANDRLGSCDTISSIVSASMIIGDDHSKKLADKCREFFSYDKDDKSKILSTDECIRHIGGDELNKEVKIILENKLKMIESKMQSPSHIFGSPESNRKQPTQLTRS